MVSSYGREKISDTEPHHFDAASDTVPAPGRQNDAAPAPTSFLWLILGANLKIL
jgi:hypothetical protein